MLFATVSEFFGQFILFMLCVSGFVGMLLKRADQNGNVKKAAGRAAVRGGVSLFKHLTK